MLSFLTDEDFNGRIVRGLLRHGSELDLVRVQDVGLQGAADETILQWAEDHQRILLTHDARTMPREAIRRLRAGLHVPGVFVVEKAAPIAACIADILFMEQCSTSDEWRDQILYLPLK